MSTVRRALLLLLFVGCEPPPASVAVDPQDLSMQPAPPPDLSTVDLAGTDLAREPVDLGGVLSFDLARPDGPVGPAALFFVVTDADTGAPMPARVVFRPPPGAGFADSVGPWSVNSPGSSTGAVVAPGVVGSPEGVLLASGVGAVTVPAGSYELFIVRGPEYEAFATQVSVGAGETREVRAALDRSVDTRGWLSADMHVHTVGSFDSRLPLDRRVISMTTNHLEVIVSTEHNVSLDYAPIISSLGYSPDVVGSVIGDEFNFVPGHGGAYPVTYNPNLRSGGIPTWTDPCRPGIDVNCTSDVDVFAMMHAQVPNTTVVAINHPWWGGADLGYFTNVNWGAGTSGGFNTTLPVEGMFEALEVLNGYWPRVDVVEYLVTDWFWLLSRGHRVSALGNSDTHKINSVRAGFPRTWLRLPTDKPGEVTGALLAEAIRKGRAIASTGPFAILTVDGAQIGDTVTPKVAGQVEIEITVDAPAWMKVDTVRLFASGVKLREWVVTPGSRPVFHAVVSETVSRDEWFVLQAVGGQPLPGDVVGESASLNGVAHLPWVITNPVFVDADGSSSFSPPAFAGPPGSLGSKARDRWSRPMPPLDHTKRVRPDWVPAECDPTEPPLDAPQNLMRFTTP